MTTLYCDLETYCEVPIRDGTARYAEEVEVMIFAWAIDDEPAQCWDRTEDPNMPPRLRAALNDPDVMTVWHNGGNFDRVCLAAEHDLNIQLPIERVHDTMVRAMAHGLPGSLDKLCAVMKVPLEQSKSKSGKNLILFFCKPQSVKRKIRRHTRFTHPAEWDEFVEYARLDVEAMRAIYKRMPKWNYQGRELELWHLDQKINRRGVAIDVELARGALAAVGLAQQDLRERIVDITRGEVQASTQRDRLLAFIAAEHGLILSDLQGATLDRILDDPDLDAGVRELLRNRQQAITTSTSKYDALIRSTSTDGRLRGTLQFCGASRTGRWAGRLFQPQNLPRPSLEQDEIIFGIEAIKAGCADLITDDVMALASSALRGAIIAPPNRKLVVSDLSNIEGRVAAWLCGEDWKLDAFQAYDDGTGHDLYILAYAKSFGVDPQVVIDDKKAGGNMRQIGKVQELALQYEGGVGAFLTFADVYGIDLELMADQAYDALPEDARKNAEGMLAWRTKKKLTTYGLSDKAYVVCETFKALWREAHPAISSYWKELEKAVIKALENPDTVVPCRMLKIRKSGGWLRIILPSGRSLCYPDARIEDEKISYMGVHQFTRKWTRLKTYGGKLFENVCQAVARDVMAHNMPEVENAGYDIVLTVHDELICEAVDTADHTSERLSALLSTVPIWAEGIPLAAGGFEAYRYKKD